MSIRFLLDENLSQIVAAQVKSHRPEIEIISVHDWHNGFFEGHADVNLIRAAYQEGLTLVTYDQRTIPQELSHLYEAGENHAGVIFVDHKTIPNNDFGLLTKVIILLWERHADESWENRVSYLEKPIV